MNIPSVDYSPLFQAFNVYAKIKSQSNQNDPFFTVAKTGLGIAEIGYGLYVKKDQQAAQKHITGIQNTFQEYEDQYAAGIITDEEFKESTHALKSSLDMFTPKTDEGRAIIDNYRTNGLNPDLISATKRAMPAILKTVLDEHQQVDREMAAKNVDSEDAYLESMQAIEGAVNKSNAELTKSQEELGATTSKRDEALKAYQETEDLERATAYEGSETEYTKKATQAAQAKALAEQNAKQFEDFKKGGGVDAYEETIRARTKELQTSNILRSEQVEPYVKSAVLYRNGLLANKRTGEALAANEFTAAREYIETHASYYASDADRKEALDNVETQKKQFVERQNQYYLDRITTFEVWENPAALKKWRTYIENEQDNVSRRKGTIWDYGAHAAEDKRKLLDMVDSQIASLEVNVGKDKEEGYNEGMDIVLRYKGQLGEKAISLKDAQLQLSQLKANKKITSTQLDTLYSKILEYSIGSDNPSLQNAYKTFDTAIEDYLGDTKKRKESDPAYIEKNGRANFMRDSFAAWLRDNQQATPSQYTEKMNSLMGDLYGKDALKTIATIQKPITRPGLGQKSTGKQLSEKLMEIESGNVENYYNFNPLTGAREIMPGMEAGIEAYDQHIAYQLSVQEKDATGKPYKAGENAIPMPLESGMTVFFVANKKGGYDVLTPKSAPGTEAGVTFTRNGKRDTTNKPELQKFFQVKDETVGRMASGNVSAAQASTIRDKLDSAYAAAKDRYILPEDELQYKAIRAQLTRTIRNDISSKALMNLNVGMQ